MNIKKILKNHGLWLANDSQGAKADLSHTNLRYAIGNSEEVKSLQIEQWLIVYTKDVLAIGCQQHSIQNWFAFDDAKKSAMDKNALKWWQKWKDILKK